MSARWITMVLALLMSSPLSTMLVDSSTSNLPSTKSCMVFSMVGRRQLAMRHGHADLRHQLAQLDRDRRQVLDARADIEGLAAAILLAQQRLADGDAVERRDEGAHGQAIDRRRGDQAHVAHAGQRELQRARDRRRRQRQHMDVGAQLLPAAPCGRRRNAAPRRRSAGRDPRTRRSWPAARGCRSRCRACRPSSPALVSLASLAATSRDSRPMLHRQALEALDEGAVVLARQQRRRRRSPRPACPTVRRRRRRAAPPRSCRSRHRRTPAGPSACPTTCPPARRRWPAAGRRSRHRGSGRRIPRRAPSGGLIASPRRMARSAAILISRSAMSAMRCFSRALRDCQATPPSRSSAAPSSAAP